MKMKPLQWYRLRGYSVQADGQTVESIFVYIVESQSKHNVVKYYGGRRKFKNSDGKQIVVYFPRHEHEIERMKNDYRPSPESLSGPQYISKTLITRVIPATRYLCSSCGKEHISEYPYPSMWCSCGKKAFPVPYTSPNEEEPISIAPPVIIRHTAAESSPMHHS